MARKPTLKQKAFVTQYIKTGNKKASVMAVYNTKKAHNADIMAQDLMKKPIIQEEIAKQLNKAGLDTDTLAEYMNQSIQTNLTLGKPSQAVASDLIKFGMKLHNVIPANKNLNLNLTKKEEINNKGYDEIKQMLVDLNKKTAKLLQDTA